MNNSKSQTINITVPKELLKQVDALAVQDYTSRSDIIRQALLEKLRRPSQQLDEWGDPVSENWQTLIDFREINPNGVPIKDVIEAMERLDEQDRKTTSKANSKTA
jgi:Arc/MetJ-type ribon-helix-helix transcriptional regulator